MVMFLSLMVNLAYAIPNLKLPYNGGDSWGISTGYGGSATHQGADYYAIDFNIDGSSDCGEPIRAVASGIVNSINYSSTGYGNRVDIDHGDEYVSRYAHLESISVSVGDNVSQGQEIGKCGSTGQSTGCHLHFVLYHNGNAQKPEPMSGYTGFVHDGGPYLSDNYYKLMHDYRFLSHSSQGWTCGYDTEEWQGNDWDTWQVHITGSNPGIVSPTYNDGMIAEYTKVRFSARVLGNDVQEQAYLWFLDETSSWNNRADIGIVDTSHDYKVYEVDLANSWGSSPTREVKQISLEFTDGGNGNDEYWTLDWLEIVSTDPGFSTAGSGGPYQPENLVATASGTSQINLSWDRGLNPPPEYQEVQYRIYQDNIAVTTTYNTSYINSGLNSGTQYCYHISAFIGSDESEKSDIACAVTYSSGGGGGTTPPNPPSANFTADVTSGYAPLTVQFTDISTGTVNSWSWNFGDNYTSTAQNPVHTYSSVGTYQVILTVTGPDGSDQETKSGYITVTQEPDPPPPAGDPDLIVNSLVVDTFTPTYIRYSYTITNIGTAPADLDGPTGENDDNVSVQAYISADEVFNNPGDIPAGGTILGLSPLGELAPGESFNGSWYCSLDNVDIETTYFLTLMIDWGEVVDESNESNNTLAVLMSLGAPANLTADAITDTQVELSWQSVQEAVYYLIYRDNKYLKQTSQISFTDDEVSPYLLYRYRVVAASGAVNSSPSNEIEVYTSSNQESLDSSWWVVDGTMDHNERTVDFHITSVPQNYWDIAWGRDFAVQADKVYRLRFTARAENYTEDGVPINIVINDSGPNYYYLTNQEDRTLITEETAFEIDLYASETDNTACLVISCGFATADLYFSNISLEEIDPSGPEPLDSSWWVVGGTMDHNERTVDFHITSVPPNYWDIAWGRDFAITNGKRYRLSFTAYAENYSGSDVPINAVINDAGPNYNYLTNQESRALTTTPTDFIIDLDATASDSTACLVVSCGFATGDLYFSNISLEELDP